ncbi:MAG TPA: prenyltransferase/squalene oxidase repeat-containing protein [Terracidiphilus sp.]|jgi:hypothetical protein|nr:prenyltransferase/squalene oxidase repeat-containing protein [Terracidiphilus sp.]
MPLANPPEILVSEEAVTRRIDRIYDILDRAYGFLFATGRKEGHWSEVRSTALAGMCVDRLPSGNTEWSHCIRDWLEGQQLEDGAAKGSWGEEIWDTAMALIALKAMGAHTNDPQLDIGLKWMASKYSVNGRGNWHDDPWETSWALLAILKSGKVVSGVDVLAPTQWLATLQDSEGRIIAPQFTAYFIEICHSLAKVDLELPDSLIECVEDAKNFLMRALSDSSPSILWTGEAWSNGQILWILTDLKIFPFHDLGMADKTINWFQDNQNPVDGHWEDAEDTASALLGLLGLVQGLTALVEGARQAREVVPGELRRRIKRRSLEINSSMFSRDAEYGGMVIRISPVKIRFLSYLGSALAAFAALAGIWDFITKHLIATKH